MSEPNDLERAVEATLFAAEQPLTEQEISAHLGGVDLKRTLQHLSDLYADRGVHLVERGGRWHFQTAPDLADRKSVV